MKLLKIRKVLSKSSKSFAAPALSQGRTLEQLVEAETKNIEAKRKHSIKRRP